MLLGAGCSTEESTTPTVELSTTSTPITTEPTTTEPSTTAAPTTTEDPRIAEVEAAVVAFREVQVEVLTNPDAPLELLEEVATDGVLESNLRAFEMRRAEGQTVTGSFEQRGEATEILSDSTATYLACGLDGLQAVSADGELLDPPDEVAVLRVYSLVRSLDGEWLVSRVQFPGSEEAPCEL